MKKFLKALKKVTGNFWVQLVFLLGCIVAIFALGGAFASWSVAGEKILEIITSIDILSIFLAAAFSLIVANVVIKIRRAMEESQKLEDDHHKIICKYSGHEKRAYDYTQNLYDKKGVVMYLDKLPAKRKRPKNPVENKTSDEYKKREKEIAEYMDKENGRLYLPNLSVYTNVLGDTKMIFRDRREKFELPEFIRVNAVALLDAHKASNTSNGDTIRLNDISYDGETLTLDTMRTQYYDMLVTNRCMDYQIDDVVSVRDVYEYNPTLTPLGESKLSNQIGINGLIFTSDGYLLLEKRGRKKAVWKNKFAQPISLAMKKKDLIDPEAGLGGEHEDAESNFKKTVYTTIGKNFGIMPEDIKDFNAPTNFLGIARDTLEGGKPNIYFFVVVDKTAEELKAYLEDKAKRACQKSKEKGLPTITRDKLDSAFYLVNFRDITVDYDYVLKVKARRIYRIKRKFAPLASRAAAHFEGGSYRLLRRFNGSLKRECGEALLACLYYVSACRERIDLVSDIQ